MEQWHIQGDILRVTTSRGEVSWVEEEDAYWCNMTTCLDVQFSGWWYCHGCLDGCYKLFWAEMVSQCRGHVSLTSADSCSLKETKMHEEFSQYDKEWVWKSVLYCWRGNGSKYWVQRVDGIKYISYRKCSHCVTTKHSYKIFLTNKNFWPFVPKTCKSYFKWIQVINVAAGFCYLPSLNSVIPHWISWVLTYIQLFISFQKSKILEERSKRGCSKTVFQVGERDRIRWRTCSVQKTVFDVIFDIAKEEPTTTLLSLLHGSPLLRLGSDFRILQLTLKAPRWLLAAARMGSKRAM